MSKLTDHLSNLLPFPREDKRYVKERSEELATSFLIKEALKTGAYLAEELEYQNLNERIQFRASRDHAVILGTMLNRIFDIRKEDLLSLYVVYTQSDCQTGKEIFQPDDIWDFDLCKAMADEEHPEMFYNQVTLCVSYTRNEETEETVLIHLKENGGDEQTRFIRASIMRTLSTEEGDVSFSATQNQPETCSILFAYDLIDPQRRIAEFEKKVEKVAEKYAKGKELDADETALIAKIAPEVGWNYSWGHEAFNEKRYWDALLYLENAFYLLKEKFFDDTLSDEGLDVFYHCCYLIGFCYVEMKLYQKAYYYLSLVWPLDNITYNYEYINCLVHSKDPRALQEIDDELERLDGLKEEEFTEEISRYCCFLLRRRAYVLTDMQRLDEAEELLKELLDTDDRTEYIQGELDYIRQLREERQEKS